MKFLKALCLTIMLSAAVLVSAQIKIPDTRVSFSFPNGGWKYLETTKISNDVNVYLYSYAKTYVVDNAGDTVIPFLRIYVRKHFSGTVFDIAYSRFMAQPFQAFDEFPFSTGGLGYTGAYSNEKDNKDYEFRMVYLIDGNTAIEMRLETTLDTYEKFEKEFTDITNTVKISK